MLAYSVGLRPSETSAICPAEVYRYAKVVGQTRRTDLKSAMSIAYATAAWQRAKKMPDLKSVLRKIDGPESPKSLFKSLRDAIRAAGKRAKSAETGKET